MLYIYADNHPLSTLDSTDSRANCRLSFVRPSPDTNNFLKFSTYSPQIGRECVCASERGEARGPLALAFN